MQKPLHEDSDACNACTGAQESLAAINTMQCMAVPKLQAKCPHAVRMHMQGAFTAGQGVYLAEHPQFQ